MVHFIFNVKGNYVYINPFLIIVIVPRAVSFCDIYRRFLYIVCYFDYKNKSILHYLRALLFGNIFFFLLS